MVQSDTGLGGSGRSKSLELSLWPDENGRPIRRMVGGRWTPYALAGPLQSRGMLLDSWAAPLWCFGLTQATQDVFAAGIPYGVGAAAPPAATAPGDFLSARDHGPRVT
jgi:hypothetical protein